MVAPCEGAEDSETHMLACLVVPGGCGCGYGKPPSKQSQCGSVMCYEPFPRLQTKGFKVVTRTNHHRADQFDATLLQLTV